MLFQKVLVALDGSKNSQIAAEYAFWIAHNLDAELAGQTVVDPRLVDLFIEPEFAEELGYSQSVETSEKVFFALRKISKTILELFATEAAVRNLKTTTYLAEGRIVEEILRYSSEFDVLVLGHRDGRQTQLPSRGMIGSVAERLAREASIPVLIAIEPLSKIKQILVAFDGSESSIGALLMAENLAKYTGSALKAVTVVSAKSNIAEAKLLTEKGEGYLREFSKGQVFDVEEGEVSPTILDKAHKSKSLLVVGAYGYGDPDRNVIGSTTSKLIRDSETSILIYRPTTHRENSKEPQARIFGDEICSKPRSRSLENQTRLKK